MTVNTLGTDTRFGSDPLAAGSTRRSWTENRWPLLAICIALFSISALVYYHLHRTGLQPSNLLPRLFAGIYDVAGLAPSVIFFLMVAAWGAIWLHNGALERPLARLGRLLMMAALLGVALNLGDGGVAEQSHKGLFGAWLAHRLVDAIGYVPTMVLVWPATFASLMLATEWFFAEYFERLRRPGQGEVGVEAAVTDHLRGLSEVAGASPRPAVSAGPRAPLTLRAEVAPSKKDALAAAAALAETLEREAAADPFGAHDAAEGDGDSADGDGDAADGDGDAAVDGEPRLSYAERRAARQARRAGLEGGAEAAFADAHADADVDVGADADAEVEVEAEAEAYDPVERAADEPVTTDAAGSGALADLAAMPDEGISDAEVFAIMASIDEVTTASVEGGAVPGGEQDTAPVSAAADAGTEAGSDDGSDDVEFAPEPTDEPSPAQPPSPMLLDGFIRLDGEALEPVGDDVEAEGSAAPGSVAEAVAFVEVEQEQSLDLPAEDLADVDAQEAGEAEAQVSIPRPDAIRSTLPTPPVVKQQQLFGGADEGLVREATELVQDTRRATAALLQRKLRVDYELACELLRELAARGIVALEDDASRGRVLDV